MKENVELVFEICVVIPKREAILKGDEDFDCSNVFSRELKNAGLVVDRVIGNSDEFYCRLMHGVVNNSKSSRILKFNRREIRWEVGEHLLPKFCRNLYLNILTTLKKVFANVHLT